MDENETETLLNAPNMPDSPTEKTTPFVIVLDDDVKRRDAKEAARLKRLAIMQARKLNRPVMYKPNFQGSE
jgi:hypothetical protein